LVIVVENKARTAGVLPLANGRAKGIEWGETTDKKSMD
jgi:hypothetical protein